MGSKVPMYPPGQYRCLSCQRLITFSEAWPDQHTYCSCGGNSFARYNAYDRPDDAVAPPPPPPLQS